MPIWQSYQKSTNLLDWPPLLVQPSISALRNGLEMVVSASTNQVRTKITVRIYAWSFVIQIQIEAVCILVLCLLQSNGTSSFAIPPRTRIIMKWVGTCTMQALVRNSIHTWSAVGWTHLFWCFLVLIVINGMNSAMTRQKMFFVHEHPWFVLNFFTWQCYIYFF